MNKRLFPAGVFLSVSASAAFANPSDPSVPPGLSLTSFVALIAEALVVSALLALRKFHFFRVFVAWLFVTQMTYWYLQGAMLLRAFMEGWDVLYDPFWLLLIVAEALVVLLEAWIIRRMSESRFFRDPTAALTKEAALGVSFAGNVVSLGISLFLNLS
jgi:hypothetical protein